MEIFGLLLVDEVLWRKHLSFHCTDESEKNDFVVTFLRRYKDLVDFT